MSHTDMGIVGATTDSFILFENGVRRNRLVFAWVVTHGGPRFRLRSLCRSGGRWLQARLEAASQWDGASSAEQSNSLCNVHFPNSRSICHGRNYSRAGPSRRRTCRERSPKLEPHPTAPRSL
jgi:hypothetical protein